MRLAQGDRVYRLIRRRLIDSEIVGCEDRWFVSIVRETRTVVIRTAGK